MPTILALKGYRFFFFSNESEEPVHIHVEFAGKYAKFWLEPLELAKNVGFRSGELRELRLVVMANKDYFKEKWDEFFAS
jgi:hypothetical protein